MPRSSGSGAGAWPAPDATNFPGRFSIPFSGAARYDGAAGRAFGPLPPGAGSTAAPDRRVRPAPARQGSAHVASDPPPEAIEFRVSAAYRRGVRATLVALAVLYLTRVISDRLEGGSLFGSLGGLALGFSLVVGPGLVAVLYTSRWR